MVSNLAIRVVRIKITSQQESGVLGVATPKQRCGGVMGHREEGTASVATRQTTCFDQGVPLFPIKCFHKWQFIAKQIKRVLGAKPLKEHYRRQFIAKQIKDRPLGQNPLLKYSQLHTSMLP